MCKSFRCPEQSSNRDVVAVVSPTGDTWLMPPILGRRSQPMVKRIMYRQYALDQHSQLSNRRWMAAVLLLVYAMLLTGCGDSSTREVPAAGELRIVSFSPALSRMVVDLGLEENIVGRTPYCDFLNADVPVVGDLLNVDYERLIDVNPTHVLIQAQAGGADRKLLELCAEHNWKVGQWASINTIDDIERVVREMPAVLYQTGSLEHAQSARRAAELLNEIALALSPGDADSLWTGDVLLMYRTNPVGVFGRHTYLSDVLNRLGATNAVEQDGWLELSMEDVARMNPPAIIVLWSVEGEDAGPLGEVGVQLENLKIDAVRDGRIALLSDPAALLPSTGIIEVAREMREALRELRQNKKEHHDEQAPAE